MPYRQDGVEVAARCHVRGMVAKRRTDAMPTVWLRKGGLMPYPPDGCEMADRRHFTPEVCEMADRCHSGRMGSDKSGVGGRVFLVGEFAEEGG